MQALRQHDQRFVVHRGTHPCYGASLGRLHPRESPSPAQRHSPLHQSGAAHDRDAAFRRAVSKVVRNARKGSSGAEFRHRVRLAGMSGSRLELLLALWNDRGQPGADWRRADARASAAERVEPAQDGAQRSRSVGLPRFLRRGAAVPSFRFWDGDARISLPRDRRRVLHDGGQSSSGVFSGDRRRRRRRRWEDTHPFV